MKLTKVQKEILLDLEKGPRAYVRAMRRSLDALQEGGWIHVVFQG